MSNRLGIGMIGCGSIAQMAGLCFLTDRRAKMSYCCDSDLSRAERFAKRFRISRPVVRYQDVIASPEVDVVYLAVPHSLHYPILKDCIAAGKPVLCEKPITTTWEDACEIVDLARICGVKIGVNYQYRYDLAVNRLQAAARRGILGKIYYARINVPWNRAPEYYSGWHGSRQHSGGGTLLTHASHAIDFTQWIIGSEAKSAWGVVRNVQNRVETEDLGMGILELVDGTVIEVCSSTVAKPERGIEVQIYTEKGTARYVNKPFPRAEFSGGRLPLAKIPMNGLFAMQRSLRAFLGWVYGQGEYLTPAEEALPALASVLGLYRSAQTNQKEFVLSRRER